LTDSTKEVAFMLSKPQTLNLTSSIALWQVTTPNLRSLNFFYYNAELMTKRIY